MMTSPEPIFSNQGRAAPNKAIGDQDDVSIDTLNAPAGIARIRIAKCNERLIACDREAILSNESRPCSTGLTSRCQCCPCPSGRPRPHRPQ